MGNIDSASAKNGLKSLLLKGLISSVALVGTTAIPILVQRSLQAPPTATTAPMAPAQLFPLPDVSPIDSAATLSVVEADEDAKADASDRKGKKKRDDN